MPKTIWSNVTLYYRSTFLHIADNSHYRVIESPVAHGIRSTLVIKPALETDFGPYTCIVENSHGRAELVITLDQQSKPNFYYATLPCNYHPVKNYVHIYNVNDRYSGKTVRGFYSTIAVVSTKAVVCCRRKLKLRHIAQFVVHIKISIGEYVSLLFLSHKNIHP